MWRWCERTAHASHTLAAKVVLHRFGAVEDREGAVVAMRPKGGGLGVPWVAEGFKKLAIADGPGFPTEVASHGVDEREDWDREGYRAASGSRRGSLRHRRLPLGLGGRHRATDPGSVRTRQGCKLAGLTGNLTGHALRRRRGRRDTVPALDGGPPPSAVATPGHSGATRARSRRGRHRRFRVRNHRELGAKVG